MSMTKLAEFLTMAEAQAWVTKHDSKHRDFLIRQDMFSGRYQIFEPILRSQRKEKPYCAFNGKRGRYWRSI